MTSTGSVPAGTRVGRYEIVSLLRQGGMGEVYAAEDSNLGRRVALKILPRNRTSDPDRVARFVREARASSTLNHPSIVAVHDAGSEGDVHFLAMELIDGQPLSEWMRRRRSLPSKIEVMAQVADGLARAHDAGIVHRDLKPDNVMVTSDGRAKIVDFGVAKLTERLGDRAALSGITTPTSRVGTTAYMAPEQIEGKTIDRRTDVFAFGVVLYELLTGANPFAAPQYADTIHNVVHLEPSLDAIPRELRRIVQRCLRKDVERRYDSMRDVALDLREAIPEVAPSRSRRRIAIAALIVVAVAAAAWIFIAKRNAPAEPVGITMTRLTNSGKVVTAAITPDGKYLVHAVQERDQQALYVKQIATGTITRIADAAPITYYHLAVSPDGNYAYYSAVANANPNVFNIYQLPLLGGAPRLIASDTEFWFSVSPDGTRVVFCRFNALGRTFRITVAAVDGSGEKVIVQRRHPETLDTPVWEPGGESITFASANLARRGEGGVYRIATGSGEITKIQAPRLPGVGSYAWLPDGSGILATVFEREQPPQIWFLSSRDGAVRKVTSEVSAYHNVHPTADSMSFSAVRDSTESNIYTLSLSSRRTEPVTTGTGNRVGGGGVRWLSDREVAWTAPAESFTTFFVAGVNGGPARRLIHSMPMWHLAVSPDGSRIAFVSGKSGANQIWVADANGANPRQVTHEGTNVWPSFTPDGRAIVYLRNDEGQRAWRIPVEGGVAVPITDRPTNRPAVSPDGKWMLCRIRSTEPNVPLWRTALVPLDGAGETRYLDVPRFGWPILLQWHPSGRSFFFVDYKDGVSNVWIQDLAGGEARQLTSFESGIIFGFDVSRDGERLLLSRGEQSRDAVLVRNFR